MAEFNAVGESIYQKHVSSIPVHNRYKLSKELDFEHEGSDVHLEKVADSMIHWIVSLATPLGLSKEDVHAITSDNQNQTILQQRAALKKWKNANGPLATYEALLKIFVNAEENNSADILCKLLRADTSIHNADRTMAHTSPPATEGINKMLEHHIKGHYSDLLVRVTGKLRERNINIDYFRLYLTSHLGCGDFISNISSVSKMIEAVTEKQLWNYYDYYALEGIIKSFAKDDSEMIGWMEEYKTRFTAFKAATKIADYIKDCTDDELIDNEDEALKDYQKSYDRKFYRELSLKLRDSENSILKVDENSLSYINEIWTAISAHFLLPPLPILLENIRKKSRIIPPVTIACIINLMAKSPGSTEFCQQKTIMRIMVDDKVVYNDENKKSDIPIANAIKY